MKITVYYADSRNEGLFTRMCVVDCGDRDIDHSLEYAFTRTQNISGSWSKEDIGVTNFDWSADVTEIAPLPVIDGEEYGHRSSMVGDVFVVEGHGTYTVDHFGFKTTPEALKSNSAPKRNPNLNVSDEAIAKVGRSIIRQAKAKAGKSKKAICEEIFTVNYGKKSRKEIISLFIDTAGLSKAGANTYYYNCKKVQQSLQEALEAEYHI
jgi:hypothetical protein